MTGSRDNDTPTQSQSERDKTVAGNEGGSAIAGVVKCQWSGIANRRLKKKEQTAKSQKTDYTDFYYE